MNKTALKKSDYKNIIKDLLLPLFPGTEFDRKKTDPPRRKGSYKHLSQVGGGTTLKLMPDIENKKTCFQIHRSQVFSKEEKKIIESFFQLAISRQLYKAWGKSYQMDIGTSILAQVVAQNVAPKDQSDFLQKMISSLAEYSQQTYEGNRIAFSAGIKFYKNTRNNTLQFEKFKEKNFIKVLSNGYDTILVFDDKGNLRGHEQLNEEGRISALFSPFRMRKIAYWTKFNRNKRSVAVVLNHNGEILVFKEGNLIFAKRRGKWLYFPHKTIIQQFTKGGVGKRSDNFRKEIYLTALDIAFSRTGGCIGVISTKQNVDKIKLINNENKLSYARANGNTEFLKDLIRNKRFHNLDRRFRAELVSIDGAVVLYRQKIFSVGILRITKGSKGGGGREAAATALAKYGLGIKISNDGYIKIFGHTDKNQNPLAELG